MCCCKDYLHDVHLILTSQKSHYDMKLLPSCQYSDSSYILFNKSNILFYNKFFETNLRLVDERCSDVISRELTRIDHR